MKKLLLILLCLFSLNTLSNASFPITENSTSDISNTINFQMDEEEDEPSLLFQYLLAILFLPILAFGTYFLFRAWWRAWKDDVLGVKILTYIIFAFALFVIIGSFTGGLAGGMGG